MPNYVWRLSRLLFDHISIHQSPYFAIAGHYRPGPARTAIRTYFRQVINHLSSELKRSDEGQALPDHLVQLVPEKIGRCPIYKLDSPFQIVHAHQTKTMFY